MDDLCFVDSSTQTDERSASTQLRGGGAILSLLTSSVPIVEAIQTPELVSALSETPALSAVSDVVEDLSNSSFALSRFRIDAPEIGHLLTQWNLDDSSLYMKDLKLQWIYLCLLGETIPGIPPKQQRKIQEVCERRFSVYDFGFGSALLFHNNDNPAVVVPDVKMSSGISLRNFLIRHYHEDSPLAAHRGEGSTLSYLRRFVWFPRMDAAVSHWVSSCVPCTIVKSQRVSNVRNPRTISYVNQHIVADWCGPLPKSRDGYRFCLIIVDAFSGFTYALPYRDRTAERTVDGILSYSALFGFPENFSSDNDPSFIGSVTSSLRDVLRIAGEVVPTYSPWTSGIAEEGVKKIKQSLSVFSRSNDIEWPILLKGILFCANSSPRYGTSVSAFQIMLGRQPTDALQTLYGFVDSRVTNVNESEEEYVDVLSRHLAEISEYWKSKIMEVRHKASDTEVEGSSIPLLPGDLCVRISYISGRRKILGRVRIVGRHSRSLYKVLNLNSNREELAHGYQLIKEISHPERPAYRESQGISTPLDYDSFYIVEKVLEYQPGKGYLVHWRGYPASERSWQKPGDMPNDPDIQEQMRLARQIFSSSRHTDSRRIP
jgi:hypothetical protein